MQEARDWGDLSSDLEPSDRVRAAFDLTGTLKELEEAGFMVFGGREIRWIEGGVGAPSNWPVAIIRVIRETNPEIIKLDLRASDEGTDEPRREV